VKWHLDIEVFVYADDVDPRELFIRKSRVHGGEGGAVGSASSVMSIVGVCFADMMNPRTA
jgi:hypothetical protein